jgi:phosphate transport system permease protein
VLAIMVLPTIASLACDALAAVPKHQRDGALSLGATKWEAILRVIVPSAIPGLLGALVLGLGRALGETMAVAMLVGNTPKLGVNLFQPADTLATLLANNFAEAEMGGLHAGALMFAALTLLAIALLVNMAGAALASRASRFHRGAR